MAKFNIDYLTLKHDSDVLLIGFVNRCGVRQIALTFGRFLCQNVTLVSMLPLDFTGACKLKALFGTGF
jgi:hypothetical protein